MTADRKLQSITDSCRAEIAQFFDVAMTRIATNGDEETEKFRAAPLRIVDGVEFRVDVSLHEASRNMAQRIVRKVGAQQASVRHIMDAGYVVLSQVLKAINTENLADLSKAKTEFVGRLVESALTKFSLIAPCELFRFEGDTCDLRCNRIRVTTAQKAIVEITVPRPNFRWELRAVDGDWPDDSPGDGDWFAYGVVWRIDCSAPEDLSPEVGGWLAQIFISSLRVGLEPAHYCHRPRLGQREWHPFERRVTYDRHLLFNEEQKRMCKGGSHLVHEYKVDTDFLERFNDPKFQEKLNVALDPGEKDTVGKRMSNSLGWAAKGRQATGYSERLLYFFVALESLLSEKDSSQPITDSIARYVSVIYSAKVSDRESIYREVKNLYELRSNVVHRGERGAHLIHANNIQKLCEDTLAVVWREVDFNILHQDFLLELKSATHGKNWPLVQ